MKENNSPLENLKDEHKMVLLRDRIRQNKWIKRLCDKTQLDKLTDEYLHSDNVHRMDKIRKIVKSIHYNMKELW